MCQTQHGGYVNISYYCSYSKLRSPSYASLHPNIFLRITLSYTEHLLRARSNQFCHLLIKQDYCSHSTRNQASERWVKVTCPRSQGAISNLSVRGIQTLVSRVSRAQLHRGSPRIKTIISNSTSNKIQLITTIRRSHLNFCL